MMPRVRLHFLWTTSVLHFNCHFVLDYRTVINSLLCADAAKNFLHSSFISKYREVEVRILCFKLHESFPSAIRW